MLEKLISSSVAEKHTLKKEYLPKPTFCTVWISSLWFIPHVLDLPEFYLGCFQTAAKCCEVFCLQSCVSREMRQWESPHWSSLHPCLIPRCVFILIVCSFVCSFICLFVRSFICLFVWLFDFSDLIVS
jgi:hypothetical protein